MLTPTLLCVHFFGGRSQDILGKIRDFEQKENNWPEPIKKMILASSKAKILLSQSDNQEIRAFLKNIASNFILKDKKFQFALKIGWRALAEGEPKKTFTNWRKGGDSNPRYLAVYLLSKQAH